jgi:formiminoglutamase
MTIILNQTRQERSKENLISFLRTTSPSGLTIACAESDQGVMANGGRLGSRWAAKSIVCQLVKMAAPQDCPYIYRESVCQQDQSLSDARAIQSERLSELLAQSRKLVHLGGGHDHVYSLMQAIKKPLLVINIDAHLDTRADAWSHSGNPFREFSQTTKLDFKLFQIGIHPFANTLSTQQALGSAEMHILSRKACDHQGEVRAFWNKILSSLGDETVIVFSIDADALAVENLKAVSAPNHNGLSLEFLHRQMDFYKQLCRERSQSQIWGFYEFNPLYDDVSGTSARVASGLIYEMLLVD